MKKYMFSAAVIVETDNDTEIWMRPTSDADHRKLAYKKSDPSIQNDRASEILRRWNSYDQKEMLELKDDFVPASGRPATVKNLKRPLGVADK